MNCIIGSVQFISGVLFCGENCHLLTIILGHVGKLFRETPGIHSPTHRMNQSAIPSNSFKENGDHSPRITNPFLVFVLQ